MTGLTKLTLAMVPLILLASCSLNASDSAICSATEKAANDHVAALLLDGGDLSVTTGQVLIAQLDAGCAA